MGVNLVMYALCLDYKSDQVHVPFIMKRRRWKPDDGAQQPTIVIPSSADAEAMSIALFSPLVRYGCSPPRPCSRSRRVLAVRARSAVGSARRSASPRSLAVGALAGEALVALTVRLAAPGASRVQRVPLGVPRRRGAGSASRSAAPPCVAIVALSWRASAARRRGDARR